MRFGGYHPKLKDFIRDYERQVSEQKVREWEYVTPEEIWFLEEIWGRVTHYDFTHLKAGFPLEGNPWRDYCSYFTYTRKNKRAIVFEVVDYRTTNLELSSAEYAEFVERRAELERQGFIVVRMVKTDSRYEMNDARDSVISAISRYTM